MSHNSEDLIAAHGWTAVPLDPQTLLSGKPYINRPEALLVKDIPFPSDDPLVAKVQEYAQSKLAPPTFNHSKRVYYLAAAILQQQFPNQSTSLSRSTLAITALLHDIGTTHDHLRATRLSFEFYGGILALDLVGKQLGAPQAQAEAVAEAIFRHQALGTRGKITFLGQLIQLATIYDNVGGHEGLVHPATTDDVNGVFPRLSWSRCFAATIREENGLKPWAHTTTLGENKFPEGVLENPIGAKYE